MFSLHRATVVLLFDLTMMETAAEIAATPCNNNTTNNMEDNSTTTDELAVSPMIAIRKEWMKTKAANKPNFDSDGTWKDALSTFLDAISSEPGCTDIFHSKRISNNKCTCLTNAGLFYIAADEKEKITKELLSFAIMDWKQQKKLVGYWIRYAKVLAKAVHQQQLKQAVFILPGTNDTLICRSALCRMIGYGKAAFGTILKAVNDNTEIIHALEGAPSNRMDAAHQEHLNSFFEDLKLFAMPRATRVVRDLVTAAAISPQDESDQGDDADADDL